MKAADTFILQRPGPALAEPGRCAPPVALITDHQDLTEMLQEQGLREALINAVLGEDLAGRDEMVSLHLVRVLDVHIQM